MQNQTTSDFGRYLTLLIMIVVIAGALSIVVPAMLQNVAEAQTTACQTVFTQQGDCH